MSSAIGHSFGGCQQHSGMASPGPARVGDATVVALSTTALLLCTGYQSRCMRRSEGGSLPTQDFKAELLAAGEAGLCCHVDETIPAALLGVQEPSTSCLPVNASPERASGFQSTCASCESGYDCGFESSGVEGSETCNNNP